MKLDFIFILACSDTKSSNRCAAKDMYVGPNFKWGRRIAEQASVPYIILSAKYGFLEPDDVIERYDQQFTNSKAGRFDGWDKLPEKYRDAFGLTIGGTDAYFCNAPKRFARLVRLPQGKLRSELKYLADAPDEIQRRIAAHRAAVDGQIEEAASVAREKLRDDESAHYYAIGQAREQLPVEALGITARAKYSDFEIVKCRSGAIRILRDGVVQPEVVKDVLRPIAAEVGVEVLNSKGGIKNTQTLGADVIRALSARA